MNKSILSIVALWLLALLPVSAQQIRVEDAMKKAQSYLNKSSNGPSRAASRVELTLAYTSADEGLNHFYVFNRESADGGFVIVGADESAQPILGYCDHGSFDFDNAPEQLKWWLSQYDMQISEGIKQGVTTSESTAQITAPQRAKSTVSNLIKTQWGQTSPYNQKVPLFGGSSCVTGCVSVCMAQIMNMYQHPTRGTGKKSYSVYYSSTSMGLSPSQVPGYTQKIDHSVDFGSTTYSWSNMLNTYTSSATTAQKNAVATLMYHAGVSVNMMYSNGASSASISSVPKALHTYFGYDMAQYVEKSKYTDSSWETLIYNEIAAGRPVIYGGQDAYGHGGHAFLVDGYDQNTNMFHINWGWTGIADGYYALTGTNALYIGSDKISNGPNKFVNYQDAVIGIKPGTGAAYYLEEEPSVGANDQTTTNYNTFAITMTVHNNLSTAITKTFSANIYVNTIGSNYNGVFQATSGSVTIPANSSKVVTLKWNGGAFYSPYNNPTKQMPTGNYWAKIVENGESVSDYMFTVVDYTPSADDLANNFKTAHSGILGKTTSTVTDSDLSAIESALSDYNSLSSEVKSRLTSEKTLLDNLKTEAQAIKDAKAFKSTYSSILSKTTSTVTDSDLSTIESALSNYNTLSANVKSKLTSEKALLDNLKTEAQAIKDAKAFKSAHSSILSKTTSTVKASDSTSITNALSAYNSLSARAKQLASSEKSLLDSLQSKLDDDAAEAAAIATAVNNFKTTHSAILAQNTSTVTKAHQSAINAALSAYNSLSPAAAKDQLTAEKALLDALKSKVEEIIAAEESEAAIVAAVNKFKSDNSAILAKNVADATTADEASVNTALNDYNTLSAEAQGRLTTEKQTLDQIKAKIDAIKAEQAALAAEVSNFQTNNAYILAKTEITAASTDKTAVVSALTAYTALSANAQALLTTEKALLDALLVKVNALLAEEETEAAIVAEVNAFKTGHAAILAKNESTVQSADKTAVDAALIAFNTLSASAQARLTTEKTNLDAMKSKVEELIAAEEAAAALQAEIDGFKLTYATIISKGINEITADDCTTIDTALTDYSQLSAAAQAALTTEHTILKTKKLIADKYKADIEKLNTAVSTFRNNNADILAKSITDITALDCQAIDKAIADYEALDANAQAALASENAELKNKKAVADKDKAEKEALANEINDFQTSHSIILSKNTDTVTADDCDAIDAAITAFDSLSDKAKDALSDEKTRLDNMRPVAQQLKEEAVGIAATGAAANNAKRYTTTGVAVGTDYRGIVIQNGKKIYVK